MLNRKYNIAVMIGRFQPVHHAHLQVIKEALKIANHVIVVVGSYNSSPNVRNPWTAADRTEMILAATADFVPRVSCISARDYLYNNNTWLHELQNRIDKEVRLHVDKNGNDRIALIGCKKDDSSFYLSFFPQWDFVPQDLIPNMDATDIRDDYFTVAPVRKMADYVGWSDHVVEDTKKRKPIRHWKDSVPGPVADWLEKYKDTPAYARMVLEFAYIKDYKNRWQHSPFKPTFVTSDAVVVRSGHILVVKRGRTPGKGLLALPGGFIGDESVKDAAIRELIEETEIDVSRDILNKSIVDSKVFDHPLRSSRGRTITHAFCFDLGDGPLPTVKGSDDAEEAMWMSLREIGINETQFFEDHLHIINHFASKF